MLLCKGIVKLNFGFEFIYYDYYIISYIHVCVCVG